MADPTDEARHLDLFAELASIPDLRLLSSGARQALAERFAAAFPGTRQSRVTTRGRNWELLKDTHRRLTDLMRFAESGEPFDLGKVLGFSASFGVIDPDSQELGLVYVPTGSTGPIEALRSLVRAGRRLPLRRCAREGCDIVFVPKRLTSRFHSADCRLLSIPEEERKARNREAVRRFRSKTEEQLEEVRRGMEGMIEAAGKAAAAINRPETAARKKARTKA